MTTALAWTAELPGLFTTSVCGAPGRPQIHLVAESTGSGWDWAAWSNHSFGDDSLCGNAVSRTEAMKKAELAARMILLTRVLQAA